MLTREKLGKISGCITLIGESGSGKSLLAKKIHLESELKNHKYLQVNICSISENLFESEFFGHVKGSFTGAVNDKKGLLEDVGYGTLFIDEISDLNIRLQVKLLSVLEEKIYYKVGSATPQKFYGRIIFASNTELERLVDAQKMRFDFFQRIKLFTYKLTPLRDRADKEKIIMTTLDDKKIQHQNFKIDFTKEALNRLKSYDYPGNYRELHSIIEYICVLGYGRLDIGDLPIKNGITNNKDLYHEALEQFEANFLLKSLRRYDYGINITSQKVKISKVTLISKIKKYGINIKELKNNIKKVS